MNIVRKIKLESLGYYICKNNTEKELFKFIKKNMLNLKQVSLKNYTYFIFYFNNKDQNIFQHDFKYNDFYVNNELIWQNFAKKFNFDYEEIQQSIKDIVEQAYKLQEITQIARGYETDAIIEQAYKLEYNEYSKKD